MLEKSRHNSRSLHGFTLVEIMIVIAIIGILAAIAIPNLLRLRMTANDNFMRKNLRTFSTANENYRAAQNPVAYASDIGDLTGSTPPYLDPSWDDGSVYGHSVVYAGGGPDALTYSLVAEAVLNQSQMDYCVDQSGVIYSDGTGGDDGCDGGIPIP